MPGGDGTGPRGMGSMTGRAAGYCAGYSAPGFANPIGGRGYFGFGRGIGLGLGLGRGRGGVGRGMGYPYARPYYGMPYAYPPTYSSYGPAYAQPTAPAYVQPTTGDEKVFLQDQLVALQKDMEAIKSRINELKKEEKK